MENVIGYPQNHAMQYGKEVHSMERWDVIRLDLAMIAGAIYGFLGALAV